MASIRFDGRRFFYTGDDNKPILLLDVFNVYENHSVVSMKKIDTDYGHTRQKEPFLGTLMMHLEPFKEKRQLGYILVILLILRQLWTKPQPIKVLRVGGSSADAFSVELAKILHAFHPDSLLCCMASEAVAVPMSNVLTLPFDMKGVQLMQGQFSVILLDDIQGQVTTEAPGHLLPALKPGGHFFCLSARPDLLTACQKLLPGAKALRAEGNLFLLTHICSPAELGRAFRLTPEGRLARKWKEILQKMDSLRGDVESLEYLAGKEVACTMQSAKELELSLSEIYPNIASVDAKMLATQFREALIDWRLGSAAPKRVRDCYAALREDLIRHEGVQFEF